MTPWHSADAASFDVSCDADGAALAAAIHTANSNGEDDVITITGSGTITLTEPLPSIEPDDGHSLDIVGPGADACTVERAADSPTEFRILEIFAGSVVNVSGLTLAGGLVRVPAGRVAEGGAIDNRGTLTLTAVTIRGNRVIGGDGDSGGHGYGGGIYNAGTLTVVDSTISGNSAIGGNAERFPGNALGGGILNGGKLTVENSTISGNSSVGGVGTPNGSAWGGGIYNNANGEVTATHLTLAGNEAELGSNLSTFGSVVSMRASIVSDFGSDDASCDGTSVTSLGYNVEEGNSCGFTGTGDLVDADPLLGVLADYGGPTQTHGLSADSAAVDHVPTADCPETDQRGTARPQGDRCDVGAYELMQAPTTPMCDGLEATIVGTPGDDRLVGDEAQDVIVGLGGNDVIIGDSDNDVICGGDGDDRLRGDSDADRLFGGAGDDRLIGGSNDDTLAGGDGADNLSGSSGDDTLTGGDGSPDRCDGDSGTNTAGDGCERIIDIP